MPEERSIQQVGPAEPRLVPDAVVELDNVDEVPTVDRGLVALIAAEIVVQHEIVWRGSKRIARILKAA